MNKESGSLADKIAGILNVAPSAFDPEDESVDATSAQVVHDDEGVSEDEEILSKFRRQNVDLLEDVDAKYAGKKASRRSLRDSDSDDSLSHNEDVSEEEEPEDEPTDNDEEEPEEESSATEDDNSDIEDSVSESEKSFKHMKDTNVSAQIKKGLCVRNQMAMWENLLETRIQLQKCLLGANRIPSSDKFNEIKQSALEFSNGIAETKNILCGVLDKFLLLQKLLLKQYPETKNLDKAVAVDDEEIPSDSEPEESDKEENVPLKKRKLEEYANDIQKEHTLYKTYRNGVIQKWYDKTRVVLKGGANSYSVSDQIDYSLSNKDKLIKRTQMKRAPYAAVGENQSAETNEEYNCEVFDDGDFYHQLLRELIEVKSADVTDPVQLGQQWIQLQNLRSKMKRKIDTRATKGRKIRYAVHSKLVNFMAPIEENSWTDEAKNELYNSLFGKTQAVK